MAVLNSFQNWLSNYWPEWAAYFVPGFVGISVLLTLLLVLVLVYIYVERRVLGRFQIRPGPNRAGPFGLLQPIADAIKVLIKEDIIPSAGDKWIHWIAPWVVFVPVAMILAVIPFQENAFLADLNIGILYIFAISSVSAIGIFMAGWGSNNKYSLMGAMRSIAQMVSYEIPMALSIIGIVLITGSLSTVDIVNQQNIPFILLQPLGFIIFFLAISAEMNRTPFDLLEAESETIAGFHTEYSGMKFGLFYLGEYGHAVVVSAIITTLFLSGWKGPILPDWLWFVGKMLAVFIFIIWIRATLPRLRIDQVMGFAWKFLFPLSLINLFITAIEVYFFPEQLPWQMLFLNFAITGVLILLWSKLSKLGGGRVDV